MTSDVGSQDGVRTPKVFSISPKVLFVSPKVILNIPRITGLDPIHKGTIFDI